MISESGRRSTSSYPQLDVEFIQVLQDMIGDLTSSPNPVEIKLFSQNPDLLKTGRQKSATPSRRSTA